MFNFFKRKKSQLLDSHEHASYIQNQKKKTTNPEKISVWKNEEWDIKLNGFKDIFSQYIDILDLQGKCIGLGARTGQEIAALRELGFLDATGVDLVPFPPYTIEGDFHNLPFTDQSVSFIYSNAVDHVRVPELWAKEIHRILLPGGYLLLNLQIGTAQDEYTVFEISNISKDLIPLFHDYEVLVNKEIPQNVHAMNWELLLQKR